jgi:hypothetical protein
MWHDKDQQTLACGQVPVLQPAGNNGSRPGGLIPVDAHRRRAGPEGGDMLSKEDSRRLAQLERQLRREDPEFCARMSMDGRPPRKRVPLSLVLVACVVWVTALILAVADWWIAAAIAALWATVIILAIAYRCRPARPLE